MAGWVVLLALGFAAGMGFLFGMIPAFKDALLHPIEVLRHEHSGACFGVAFASALILSSVGPPWRTWCT